MLRRNTGCLRPLSPRDAKLLEALRQSQLVFRRQAAQLGVGTVPLELEQLLKPNAVGAFARLGKKRDAPGLGHLLSLDGGPQLGILLAAKLLDGRERRAGAGILALGRALGLSIAARRANACRHAP